MNLPDPELWPEVAWPLRRLARVERNIDFILERLRALHGWPPMTLFPCAARLDRLWWRWQDRWWK